MITKPMRIAGINAKIFKLGEASGQIDRSAVDSIFKHGRITDHIYHRVRKGVLVLFCSVNAVYGDIELAVEIIKQKIIDQKLRQISNVAVFEFNH